MNFIDKMAERFMKVNKRMRHWKRVVSVLSAVVVFATTYALILPAITLDVQTASTQEGMEIAASENESESGGTVYEAEPEEKPDEEDEASLDTEADTEDSEEQSVDENANENSGSENGSNESEPLEETKNEETDASDESGIDDDIQISEEAAKSATTALTDLIIEDTQLIYEADEYIVYADFGESAKFPVGVELRVKEITEESDPDIYAMYYEKALGEMQDKYDESSTLSFARFYDIAFVYEDTEIEPNGNVSVRIEYKKAVAVQENTTVDTIHFDKNDDEKVEVIDSDTEGSEKKVEAVEFESDQFSVYGIVGTETITVPFTTGDGRTYEVTVNYDKEAGIPEGAKLSVTEVTDSNPEYDSYVEQTADAIGRETEDLTYIKLLNISILDKDDNEVEITAPVDVQIRLLDVEQAEDSTQVVHFGETTDVIDPEVSGDALSFETNGFSIYAVVDSSTGENARLKVIFKNGDTVVKTMYVKKADVDNNKLEQVLYDPGVPTEDNKKFIGWTDVQNYDEHTEGKTIATIRDEVTAELNKTDNDAIHDGDEVTYYAMMFTSFELYYQDEHGITFKTQNLLIPSGNSATGIVNATYSVDDTTGTRGFIGWVVDGTENDEGHAVYKNGDSITVSADTTLIPEIGDGHWLSFDENDGGAGVGNATYTPPAFVPAGETAAAYKPDDPERPGYTFAGWYTAAVGGSLFDFENTVLTENTPVYAHWTAEETASYKVIIWAQKVTDDKNAADADKEYDYVNSYTLTAATDTQITADTLSAYTSYGNTYFGANDLANGSVAFVYRTYEIINGGGADKDRVNANNSTVVNVYYDRALFTIITGDSGGSRFTGAERVTGNYALASSFSSGNTYYALIDGEYVPVTYTKVLAGITYKFKVEAKSTGSTDSYCKNYDLPVGPLYSTNNTDSKLGDSSDNFEWDTTSYYWTRINTKGVFNGTSGAWYKGKFVGSNSYVYRFIIDSTGGTYTGPVYTSSSSHTYYSLTGLYGQPFSKYGYKWNTPTNTREWKSAAYLDAFTGDLFGSSNQLGGVPNMMILERSTAEPDLTIIFYIQDTNGGTTNADYTEYDRANYKVATGSGFNITGRILGTNLSGVGYKWSSSESKPTSWDTGTTDGYTTIKRSNGENYLHIKYNRVKSDIIFTYGSDEVGRIKDIPYGKSLSEYESQIPADPTNIPENYYFVGWYADPEGVNEVDWNGTMPLGNMTVYAVTKPVEYHVVIEPNGGTVDSNQALNFWVPYETILDDTYFSQATKTVEGSDDHYSLVGWYLDEDCTQPWLFTTKITDASLAIKYSGPNDPLRADYDDAVTAEHPEYAQTVGVFKLYAKWRNDSIAEAGGLEIQYTNPAGEGIREYSYTDPLHYADQADVIAAQAPTADYVPTGKQFVGWKLDDSIYYPGQTFVADSALAEAVETEETDLETGEALTKRVITLVAEYADAEDRTPTHIYWYKNDGSGETYREDEDLGINESVYVYGVSVDPDTGDVSTTIPTREGYKFLGWAKDTEREEDSDTVNTSTTKTELFITYDSESGSYDITKVAADEVMPYDGLYAVWQLEKQKVKIYSYDTSNASIALENAVFNLTGPEGSGISYTGLTTNSAGYLEYSEDGETKTIFELPLGSYTLTEVTPPSGYNIISQTSNFTVRATDVIGTGSGYYTEAETGDTGVYIVKVANSAGVELPHTGGPGTLLYTLSGLILVIASALMYGFRMRRRERRLN